MSAALSAPSPSPPRDSAPPPAPLSKAQEFMNNFDAADFRAKQKKQRDWYAQVTARHRPASHEARFNTRGGALDQDDSGDYKPPRTKSKPETSKLRYPTLDDDEESVVDPDIPIKVEDEEGVEELRFRFPVDFDFSTSTTYLNISDSQTNIFTLGGCNFCTDPFFSIQGIPKDEIIAFGIPYTGKGLGETYSSTKAKEKTFPSTKMCARCTSERAKMLSCSEHQINLLNRPEEVPAAKFILDKELGPVIDKDANEMKGKFFLETHLCSLCSHLAAAKCTMRQEDGSDGCGLYFCDSCLEKLEQITQGMLISVVYLNIMYIC